MNSKIILLAIICAALACNDRGSKVEEAAASAPKSLQDSLYKAVEKGHNEAMAKISKLARSSSQVKQVLDSLNKLPKSKIDTAYRRQLLTLQEDLEYAQIAMDKWMTEFKYDSAENNPEQRIKYLESEKEKVTKVRDNIFNSLQRADSLLKQ